jgi:hypothetical protein
MPSCKQDDRMYIASLVESLAAHMQAVVAVVQL